MEPTERIEFPDGQWWTIKATITRRMRKRINHASIKMMKTVPGDNGQGIRLEPSIDVFNPEALNDIMLQDATVAWSFEEEVSPDAIDDKAETYTNIVLIRLGELYEGRSAQVTQELKKN